MHKSVKSSEVEVNSYAGDGFSNGAFRNLCQQNLQWHRKGFPTDKPRDSDQRSPPSKGQRIEREQVLPVTLVSRLGE